MTRLVHLDCESTGLDETVHVPWEVAAIVDDPDDTYSTGEWVFRITPTAAELSDAEPKALAINHYYHRTDPDVAVGILARPASWPALEGRQWQSWHEDWQTGRRLVAGAIANLLDGATIVGSNPDFDKGMLTWFLRRNKIAAAWHYHSYDIRPMAYAQLLARHQYLGEEFVPTPETRSADLFAAFGVSIDPAVAHTALGDARHVRAVWRALHGEAVDA